MSCIYVDRQYDKCMECAKMECGTTFYSKGGLRWRCSGQNEEFTMYINGQ